MKELYARILSVVLLLLSALAAFPQCPVAPTLTIQNPSFEGPTGAGITPGPWNICMPTSPYGPQTPDTQPGNFGVGLPPTNGSSYLGLVYDSLDYVIDNFVWEEGASEPLSGPMVAGIPYTFTIDLANSGSTGGGIVPGCAELHVWGGFGYCDQNTLLWSSGNITPFDVWQTYTVTFTPTQNFTYIMFQVYGLGCSTTPYILLDNISPITSNNVGANTLVSNNVLCAGQNSGSAVVHAVGQNGPFTYAWNSTPAQTDSVLDNVGPGTYTVTVTDVNTCTATASVSITSPTALTLTPTISNVTCNGFNTGSAYMSYAGGTPPITFAWSNGPTTQANPNLFAGTYSITATDANSCTATASISITQPAAISIAGSLTQPTCTALGSIATTVTNGTPNYTYVWNTSPVQATANATGLNGGTYNVTVTDANSCTASSAFTLNAAPPAPSVSATPSPVLCFGQSTGSVAATASGGGGGYTYAWNTAPVQNTATATNLPAGTYTVTVTDAGSCTVSASATITQPAAALSVTTSKTDVLCFGASTGSVTAVPAGGTGGYSFSWNTTPVQNTATVNNRPAGTYTVTVTDANNCTVSASVTVSQPTQPLSLSTSKTDESCFGGTNATATCTPAGGTAGYTYTWNTIPLQNTATATGLVIGSYTVTVNDANSCTASASVTITQPAATSVSITKTEPVCFGQPAATATATGSGGTGAFTYAWNTTPAQNTQTASNLGAGTYTVTATDASGCTATASITINTPPTQLTVAVSHVDVLCFGNSTGSVTAMPSGSWGGYTYGWNTSPAQNSATAANLAAGTYTVTVTDAQGCSVTASDVVSQPAQALSVTASKVDELCFGGATGSATANPAGGTTGYTYVWSCTPVQNTATATNLAAASYTVTVSDANSCTASASVSITQPTATSVTITKTEPVCFGQPAATATATGSGGTGAFTYAWNTTPAQNTQTATNLSGGTYTVTATDANGCTATASITISTPPTQLTVAVSHIDVLCFGNSTGSVTAAPTGSWGGYTYTWNTTPAQNTASAANLPAGTYNVTVTDVQGCSTTASDVVAQPAQALTVSQAQVDVVCFGASTGSASVTAGGGTAAYTYSWNTTPVQNTATATNLAANAYTVTVTDANSCTATAAFNISQPASPVTVNITLSQPLCFGQPTASAQANGSGGTGTITYTWNTTPAQNSQTAINLAAGNYTVTATDASGCSASASVSVSAAPSALTVTTTHIDVLCFGDATGSVTANANGSYGSYSYVWNTTPVQSTATASSLIAGTYNVTVTDIQGCSATASDIVSEPASALSINTTKTDILCYGDASGSATVTANGGTVNYTYNWSTSPVQNTATISSLVAGAYTITVTDANNCLQTASVTINQPAAPLAASSSITNVNCNGGNDGGINISCNGGTTNYSYQWSVTPSVNTPNATGLTAGNYSMTVTDANNCTFVLPNMQVTEPTALSVNLLPTDESCPGSSDGEVDATASGGIPPYSYAWNNGITDPQNTSLTAGTYTITVTDGHNCTISDNSNVNSLPGVVINGTAGNVLCFPLKNGSINITATTSFQPLQFVWSNGAATEDITALDTGTYSLIVTDAHGCQADSTFHIGNDDIFSIEAAPHNSTIDLGQQVNISVTPTGSTFGTLVWTPTYGLSCSDCSDPIANPYESITYNVVATDVNGCIATDTVHIEVIPSYIVFIPNAFTPNGDGNNDFFEVFGNKEAWKQFEVQIFDRSGEMVYESNDMNFKWDGNYKGKMLNPSVFVYLVKVVYIDNYTDKLFKGSVTLVR